ncbi:hypothetical protein [Priestia aryabhattai]|uniref:hypothetical protein n=1 Tax=Priestia aryabhattai TaxID=412384 RepID=UPI001C0E23AB|nr:hypothetical protein [Priestia aryabhattai]MBU3568664.1 hypothetical protein [Priestia aryabhattai]
MLGLGLVAYIFHEMDEGPKDVPTTKVEPKKNWWELGESHASSSEKSENKIELYEKTGDTMIY